jgi:hypothetical protein
MHNFKLVNADTDSITICKQDEAPFTEEERALLLEDLNSQFPEGIHWEDDGYYPKVVVLKAKNYILYDGKKIKLKGSALKATMKAPALREFIKEIINYIIFNDTINQMELIDIYYKYVKEINNITDIKRWATRKTISEKVLKSERTNESKIRDAIEGSEIVEGDRCYVYYTPDNSLKLVQDFDNDYNKDRLFQNLYDTAWVFETVLDCEFLFPNFKLKKNKKQLENIIND